MCVPGRGLGGIRKAWRWVGEKQAASAVPGTAAHVDVIDGAHGENAGHLLGHGHAHPGEDMAI